VFEEKSKSASVSRILGLGTFKFQKRKKEEFREEGGLDPPTNRGKRNAQTSLLKRNAQGA